VKLGKNATDIQCCPRFKGGEAMKKSRVSEWLNSSKRVVRTWKIIKEVVIQDLTEPMKI
jgi:hypothetical protein